MKDSVQGRSIRCQRCNQDVNPAMWTQHQDVDDYLESQQSALPVARLCPDCHKTFMGNEHQCAPKRLVLGRLETCPICPARVPDVMLALHLTEAH